MTHWKLWEQVETRPVGHELNPWFALTGERWKPKATNLWGRREQRRDSEGTLTQGNTGSRRTSRRWLKRVQREKARVKQGLLPRMLRP